MKKELTIGMAIDNYKLPDKEKWWKMSLNKTPEIRDNYDLVSEKIMPGLTPDTSFIQRVYKKREQ